MVLSSIAYARAAEIATALAVTLLLIYFHRRHLRTHLRDWTVAFAALIAYELLMLVELALVAASTDRNPVRLLTSFLTVAALLTYAAALAAGIRQIASRERLIGERRAMMIMSGVSFVAAVALTSSYAGSAVLIQWFEASHAVLIAAVALSGTWMTWRMRNRRQPGITRVILSAGFALYAVAGISRLFAIGLSVLPDLSRLAIVLAPVAMIVLVLAAIIALLEDEREAAVAAASEVGQIAHHDPLTGLPNRTLLFDRVGMAMAHASRHRHKVAVLFLDLDRLKVINDSLGHTIGDTVIRTTAERLRTCVRDEDTVARFGGDEFVALLHIVARSEDAGRVAQKMLEAVSAPMQVAQREIVVTPSIGISIYPSDGADAETLLRNADTAMYRAKEQGRDGYQFFTPAMNARAVEVMELESRLRRAVARDEFVLHYQPLIDLERGTIYGLEALLRWQHPELGLLAPDRFLSTAENTGLIVPIGNWVLREACKQAKKWHRQLGHELVMSVNLSARQLQQNDLIDRVKEALAESGLRSRFLELEITETNAMQDVEKTLRILRELKALGVRLSIDDFGTGYSSLSYLKQFPVDTLKLDQSFVREINVPEDGAIAGGVIAMAHSLQLKVLAEGVETLSQLDFLRSRSCDRLQGFLFSRPLEPALFERFFAQSGKLISVA